MEQAVSSCIKAELTDDESVDYSLRTVPNETPEIALTQHNL